MDDDDANELCEAIQAICDYAEASDREDLVKPTRILREFKRILSS